MGYLRYVDAAINVGLSGSTEVIIGLTIGCGIQIMLIALATALATAYIVFSDKRNIKQDANTVTAVSPRPKLIHMAPL